MRMVFKPIHGARLYGLSVHLCGLYSIGRLSVRLHRSHTSIDKYSEPFTGTLGTPSVVSDRTSKPHVWNRDATVSRSKLRQPCELRCRKGH